jgi:hypothetical protein
MFKVLMKIAFTEKKYSYWILELILKNVMVQTDSKTRFRRKCVLPRCPTKFRHMSARSFASPPVRVSAVHCAWATTGLLRFRYWWAAWADLWVAKNRAPYV